MQSRCSLHLVFALSSLILSKAQDVIRSGHSCLRSSPADDGLTRVTFLRERGAGVRSLYLTLWSGDMRLVTCEVNTNPVVTERYRALCDGRGAQGGEISHGFDVGALLAPDAPCALVSTGAPKFSRRARRRDETEGKSRRKRWIFPGTLWCGTGSKAGGYDELGMFESADRCCREHDYCPHMIPAFTVNYGVFNSKFFTVSHCDCDQRFRQCLLDVNDTISSMVGYSFFNILQVPCFELKQQKRCTLKYWWGMCKVAKEAPYAVFQSQLPFNSTGDNADSGMSTSSEGKHVTESPVVIQHTKSPKSKHRCSSKDPPRGDYFYHRRKKGKGCKKHWELHTVASSQTPSISRAHTSTPSIGTSLSHASKSSTNRKMAGRKKSTGKGLLAYSTKRSHVPPQVTTISYPPAASTTQGTPFSTQEPSLQLHLPTAITAVTKTTKSHKKRPKQGHCCGFKIPLRGDTFQPRCKSCLEQNTTSPMKTVAPSTTTNQLLIKVTKLETRHFKNTPKQNALKTLWSTATSATRATSQLKSATSIHKVGKPRKQMDSHLLWKNTSQELLGRTKAPNTDAGKGLKRNIALHNMTDNQLLCRSLKHLDDCKYKIPPLEKKYDLQNRESKTAFHCDCTSRLAAQIESFKQPSVLPTLLMDFVSQRCFKLPKEKKCHSKKRCSGGFSKASDLLRALKKIEEKDTAGVRNSGNDRKRGIPVRLYKRCLRLEREADTMAQLERL